VQSAGLVLGAVSLASGVGAAFDVTLVLGELDVTPSALALTSFGTGSVGSGLDGPACLSGHDALACAGFYLNASSAFVGGAGSLAELLSEDGASTLLPKILQFGGAGLGDMGLGSDAYALFRSCGNR
jgi:hypothetical protein